MFRFGFGSVSAKMFRFRFGFGFGGNSCFGRTLFQRHIPFLDWPSTFGVIHDFLKQVLFTIASFFVTVVSLQVKRRRADGVW